MVEVTKKAKTPAEHPTYSDMVKSALGALKERIGASRQAIEKYIKVNYKVGDNCSSHLKLSLKRMLLKGTILQTKGKGATGSYKLNKAIKEEKPKKKVIKKPVKKTAAKKPVKKPAENKAKSPSKTPKKAGEAKKNKKPVAKPKAAQKVAKTPAKKPAKKTATPTVKKAAKKTTKPTAKKAAKSPKK